jgi:tungstate transport system ATP-binding protein
MKAVKKSYNKEVLHVEHLTLTKGCIYGIIGPSGAGKSTLLRVINLLTAPSSGEIFFSGSPVPVSGTERLTLQRKMALVFQQTLLFKDSVWNNVAYGLKARGFPKAVVKERVDSLLEQVGLKEFASRRADTLSGGEAQRVAIARAVAFEPELLLLDEPTANLDPGNIELIEEMITNLARSKEITVIMVTHNIFQARRIADQVIFINQGKIIEMGPTEKIFSKAENESTRQFVEGRMVY